MFPAPIKQILIRFKIFYKNIFKRSLFNQKWHNLDWLQNTKLK